MPLIEEALLGAVFGALIQAICIAKEKATFFKKTLEHLESTLQSVGPIMEQVIKSKQVQSDVSTRFVQQLEKAKILVETYSDIRMWKFLKRRKVKKLIQQMDASLQRLLARDFQVEQLAYLTDIVRDVAKLNEKMDRVIALLEGNKVNIFESPEPDEKGVLSNTQRVAMEAEVIGAVIGVAFEKLYDSVAAAVAKSSELKFQLKVLETTVRILTRKFQEIGELLMQLEQKFPDEIVKLQQLLEKAKQLVSESSTVSTWNFDKKIKYKKRLAELDLSIKEMLKVDFPAAGLNYTAQVLVKFVEMNKKLDVIFD